jgi:hypothetical protein
MLYLLLTGGGGSAVDAGNLLLSSAHYKALSLFNCLYFRLMPYA